MTVPNGDEREIDTATLRVAIVTWKIFSGWTPTTRDVAELCSMADNGAWAMLVRMSDVLPIYLDREDFRWRLTDGVERQPCHYVVTP
jgi:hypothetical protein